MRKIKFRGKPLIGDEWIYGSYLFDEVDNEHLILQMNNKGDIIQYVVREETVGQLLNLKTLDDKEIYEGDVLAYPTTEKFNEVEEYFKGKCDRMVVEYHEQLDRFGLSFESIFGGEGYTGDTENIHRYINEGLVVIGNIHDNKDIFYKK